MFDNQLTDLLARAERGIEAALASEEIDNSRADDQRPVELQIEFGRTRLQADDVERLRNGSIVLLDAPLGEPAAIYAAEQLVGRGETVVVNGKIGVRVTDLVPAAPLAASQTGQQR
jgi:flagellar motor switch protein FliN/FliY